MPVSRVRARFTRSAGNRSERPWWLVLAVGLVLCAGSAVLVLGLTARPSLASTASSDVSPLNIYVNSRTGGTSLGSKASPFKTIQAALDVARPGSVIHLEPGVYVEEPVTRVDGTPSHPIVVEGEERGMSLSDRFKTVLYGTGHVFSIKNNYYTLRGFTIDGQQVLEQHRPLATWPTKSSAIFAFKQSMQPYVRNSHPVVVDGGPTKDVAGTVLDNMWISGAAGECVRFRDGAEDATVENSVIEWCGLQSKSIADTYLYHNGEGIYIGTSPKSTAESRHADDPTNHIVVKNDRILTFGSECVDIKENAFDNSVLFVTCGDNEEPLSYEGSNLEIRGYGNTVEDDLIMSSTGYGVKIASDDARKYKNNGNVVQFNVFKGQTGAPIVILSNVKQRYMCSNEYATGRPVQHFGAVC